jgi:CBS domain containing-hemolysin-like protein
MGVSCFYASAAIALNSYSRARLSERMRTPGVEGNPRLQSFLDQEHRLSLACAAMRAAMNLVVLVALLHALRVRYPERDPLHNELTALGLSLLFISVFGVAIPGSLAQHQPEAFLVRALPVLRASGVLLAPVVWFMGLFEPIVRSFTGAEEPQPEDLGERVMSAVEEHGDVGRVDETQKALLEAVFEMPKITAGEVMTPRTQITGVELSSSLAEVRDALLANPHSRVPVYEGVIDRIVGILYAKDLISFVGSQEPFDIRAVMREPTRVPETKLIAALLAEFRTGKVQIAIVLDEYGGTAGLVTLEDILEQLVGDIRDEYEGEATEQPVKWIDEHTAEVDAGLPVDEVNEQVGLSLPEDGDFDTLAGFVFSTLGHIPEEGEVVELPEGRIVVLHAQSNKINRVRVEKNRPEAPATEPPALPPGPDDPAQ